MNFITGYGTKVRPASPAGSKIIYEHEIRIDKNGKRHLEKTKAINIYEKIQESKDSCMIENILARYAQGDLSALNGGKGVYADLTEMPKSLAEMQNMMIKAEQEFSKLPKEIREKFDNNAEQYIAEYGGDKWGEKLGFKTVATEVTKEVATKIEKEVKSNE